MDASGRIWEGDSVQLAAEEVGLIGDAGTSCPAGARCGMGCEEAVFAPLILRIVLAKACARNDCGIPGVKCETWVTHRSESASSSRGACLRELPSRRRGILLRLRIFARRRAGFPEKSPVIAREPEGALGRTLHQSIRRNPVRLR